MTDVLAYYDPELITTAQTIEMIVKTKREQACTARASLAQDYLTCIGHQLKAKSWSVLNEGQIIFY